jgi:hypothetical protein
MQQYKNNIFWQQLGHNGEFFQYFDKILRLIAVLTSHYDKKIVKKVEGLAMQGSCPRFIANVANLFCFNTAKCRS